MDKILTVLDLETTGLDPFSDKIIEVGLVRLEKGEIAGTFHTLVNPNRPLPLKIKRLTGLNDNDLAMAPNISQVCKNILEFIGNNPISGHNVRFDLNFLEASLGRPFQNKLYDTLELAKLVLPTAASHRLDKLCACLNINFKTTHRALDDAMAAARLLNVLIRKLYEIDLEVLSALNELLKEAQSSWHGFLTGLIKDIIKKFPDKKITAIPYWKRKEGKTSLSCRDYPVERKRLPLQIKKVTAIIGKEGYLASILPGYEYRPQQEAIAEQITRAINEEKYLLLEAGTGIGKSMAYLIPSVLWSLLNKEKVLVATYTINLQEQLWHKDIPILTKAINKPFKAALAKGRQNYICLRKWFLALEGPHRPEEAAFFARILTWLTTTTTGDKSELNINFSEEDYWFTICGEAEGCLGSRCHFQEDCFVNKAKKEAEEADLIITNHSLLFSDVKAKNRVLPAYGPLIIDEAHHLEESATAHLGRKVSRTVLNRWLVMAGKVLVKLAERTPPPGNNTKWTETITKAQAERLEAIEAVRLFFQILYDMAVGKTLGADGGYSRLSIRLPCDDNRYGDFLMSGRKCIELLRGFVEKISSCIELMEFGAALEEAWAGASRDLAQIRETGLALIDDMQFILEGRDENFVYWAELETAARGPLRDCSLMSAPINAGHLLYEQLFKNKSTVILASATLTVNGSFDHFIERNGLNNIEDERLIRACFESPFAYDRQVLLCINRDLPAQGEVAENIYLENLENSIYKLLEAAGGRTLVLFTSHRILREIYARLKPKLEALDICLLGHGLDGSRSKILEEFKSTERTVLFGASSFWEGVDVPGDALNLVIMVKLPFASPSAPVMEARLEDMARQNKDGFRLLSIPQAVIRFKQGFGRLIRSSSDSGCVVILDGRILSKTYGRQFLNSLPLKSHFKGDIDVISKKISEWIYKT